MAPEVLFGEKYDQSADSWSLGIMFYYMLFGFYPFNAKNGKIQFKNCVNQGDYQIPKTVELSLQGIDFLNTCLQFDPKNRGWQDIKNHDYLLSDGYEIPRAVFNGVDMQMSAVLEPHSNVLKNPTEWLTLNQDKTHKMSIRSGVQYAKIVAKQVDKGI